MPTTVRSHAILVTAYCHHSSTLALGLRVKWSRSGTVERRQSFFLEHTDDVISLAVGTLPGPNGSPMGVVATGELGPKPKIEVRPSPPHA
jgi:hypothetical protein